MGNRMSTELGDQSHARFIEQSLNVMLEGLNSTAIGAVEAKPLGDGLDEVNEILRTGHLDLPNQGLQDHGVVVGAGAVAQCAAITHVDISYNHITTKGVLCLINALQQIRNKTLLELRLSGNQLDEESVQAICGWLEDPGCPLKRLYLYNCDLYDESALLLAKMLQDNTSLEYLDICRNHFTHRTFIMMSQALEADNVTIQSLRLDIGDGIELDKEAHKTLTDCCTEIDQCLQRNANLLADQLRSRQEAEERSRREREALDEDQDEDSMDRDRRLHEELRVLESTRAQQDEDINQLEQELKEKLAKKRERKSQVSEASRMAVDKAIDEAYAWRDKVTANGTLQKEWKSGFTTLKTEPGCVGGLPVITNEKPRRLKACWCEPADATALFSKKLHYHCKWEQYSSDLPQSSSVKKGDTYDARAYQGCRATGHICASVGFFAKPRPNLSPVHFFASPHPVERQHMNHTV